MANPWDNDPIATPAAPEAAPAPAKAAAPWQADKVEKMAHENDVSGLEATGRGLKSGVLMDHGDEISGASAAGVAGLPPEAARAVARSPIASGLAALGGGIRMGAEYLFPETFGTKGKEAYVETRDAERKANEAAQEQHPYIYTGANIGGSLIGPGAAYKKGASLGMNALRMGSVSGGQGVVQGAGDAEEIADVPWQAVKSGAIGFGVGAGLPLVGAAAKATGKLGGGVRDLVQGAYNPEAVAMRRTKNIVGADRADPKADILSRADVDAAGDAGQNIVVGDLGASRTGRLARAASNTSEDAGADLRNATGPRYADQKVRTGDFVEGLFPGGLNMTETNDKLLEMARKANGPRYDAAHAAAEKVDLWDDTLERLANAPAVNQAMKDVEKTAANAAVLDGHKPVRNPFTVDKDGNMAWKVLEDGSTVTPNLSYWDHVQRNLQAQIENAGSKTERAQLIQLKNQLNSHLDNLIPEFGEARGMARHFFGAENMLEAGQKFANQGSGGAFTDMQKAFAKANPVEQELFQRGMMSEIVNKIRNARDGQDVVKMFDGANRRKLEAFLPGERLDQVEAFVRRERIMNRLKDAIGGNSTTAQQLKDMGMDAGLMGGGAAIGQLYGDATTGGVTGVLAALGRRGRAHINKNVMGEIGRILSSDDPKVINDILSGEKGKEILSTLRKLDIPASNALTREAEAPKLPSPANDDPSTLTIRPNRKTDGFAEGGLVGGHDEEKFMRDIIDQVARRVRGGGEPMNGLAALRR